MNTYIRFITNPKSFITFSCFKMMINPTFNTCFYFIVFYHTYYMTNWYISVDRTNGSRWLYIWWWFSIYMSRAITESICNAFENRQKMTMSNSHTDGNVLYLHGNAIARFTEDGDLEISNAGWTSNTTKERLNGLRGVSIHQRNFQWFLNDVPWNGDWTKI